MKSNIKSRKKRSIIWNVPKEQLSKIILESSSYSEILRKLNIFSQGSNINTLKRRIEYENIDTSHIPKGLNSCKGRKFGPHINSTPNSELFIENCAKDRSIVKRRLIRDSIISYECSECGLLPIWNNKPISMVLDHINGVPNDNRIENLRFLCPNCNSQTDTFAGRNVKRSKSNVIKTPKVSIPRKRKFEVTKEELQHLVDSHSLVAIGKKFGVSDNAIRKRCKILGIII
jgi:predicted RNA-binding Zn-ribbon protein involved in translation (DUF1610 family)